MTEQYAATNINVPRGSRSVFTNTQLTFDDELVVIVAGAPTLTLPDARQIPSWGVMVKSIVGLGAVDGLLGQTIDGAGIFTFSSPQEALVVRSDGANWVIEDSGSGGGAALEVEDEGVPVELNTTLLNFIGPGVTAASAGVGAVDVTIPGGAGTDRQEDITTQNIVGTDTTLADTLGFQPRDPASVQLQLNGVVQVQGAGNDYILIGATDQSITWLASSGGAVDMATTDELIAYYISV